MVDGGGLAGAAGALLGTPAYMAPEQMAGGEITPAVDVFAFCVALHEALYGQRPFRSDTIANLYVAIVDEGPAATTTVQLPRRLGRALRRGLAADPGARPASMHALLSRRRRPARGCGWRRRRPRAGTAGARTSQDPRASSALIKPRSSRLFQPVATSPPPAR